MAQETTTLDRLEVALWPEFDRAAVLVLYRIKLDASVALPATVAVPIPTDVGIPHAVAKRMKGQLYNQQYERVVNGDTATINIKTDSKEIQIEYYAPITMKDAQREVVFVSPPGLNIKEFAYEVQQPAGATDFALTPSHSKEGTGANGLKHYLANLGPLAPADQATIKITYQNPSKALSLNLIKQKQAAQVPAPGSGAAPPPFPSTTQPPIPPQAQDDGGLPWWIYLLLVGLALLWAVPMLTKKKKE
jgi:hypothetical protein